MQTKLTRTDDEILSLLKGVSTKQEIANLLEVSYSTIVYLLYRRDKPTAYKRFLIKKRNGGEREIYAPISSLKILQRKLSHILYLIYRPRHSVFGFCKNKNIVGNAHLHSRKKVVLNLDLEDFFPTVHIGRVIGLFRSKPFNLPKDVAVMLAQICCHEGKLPQGAPTSPVIANMICSSLDTKLHALAKENHCVFSRYADDISFSTSARTLGDDIAKVSQSGFSLGPKLISIIEAEGFKINASKIRIQTPNGRQEVTGLTVNEFANVKREYVREIRAMLHVWRRFGEEDAARVYYAKFNKKYKNSTKGEAPFRQIVKGKLSFLKAVRGEKNAIYRKLLNKYNRILDPHAIDLPVGLIDELKSSLWVVKTAAGYVGTAFMLQGKGLITCAHVVGLSPVVKVIHWSTGTEYDAAVVTKNAIPDMAILDIQGHQVKEFTALQKGRSGTVAEQDVVTIAGFPGYQEDDPPQCWDAKVSARRGAGTTANPFQIERFSIDRVLFGGMSGSPVVNQNNEVVAIATYGSPTVKEATTVWDYGITPIYHLDNMA